jgi:hypothetical protein
MGRDMQYFYETVQSLGGSVDYHKDATAKDQHLRKMGYALLDTAKLSCRLMMLLVEKLSVLSSEGPVPTP